MILFCLFSIIKFAFPQNTQEEINVAKYWYYKDRLKYYVIPGTKHGESQIGCVRNYSPLDYHPYQPPYPPPPDDQQGILYQNIDYGQHGKFTGLYWGVLATEYYLLLSNGQTNEVLIEKDFDIESGVYVYSINYNNILLEKKQINNY